MTSKISDQTGYSGSFECSLPFRFRGSLIYQAWCIYFHPFSHFSLRLVSIFITSKTDYYLGTAENSMYFGGIVRISGTSEAILFSLNSSASAVQHLNVI